MKTKTVVLYRFDELSEEVKKKVIRNLRSINVHYGWWDYVYDDFVQLAEQLGFEVDLKKTSFVGFYHQGEGSAFNATIDVKRLIGCVESQSWKEQHPEFNYNFRMNKTAILRIARLISSGHIEFQSRVVAGSRDNLVYTEHETIMHVEGRCSNPENTTAAIEQTEAFIADMSEALNLFFFRMLRQEFEFLTSRGMIINTIKLNDYYFTESGKGEFDCE